jgi:hypothetical protein
MRRRFTLTVLILTFIFLTVQTTIAQKQNAPKWEYLRVWINENHESKLNKLGEAGWEVTSVNESWFTFKRQKGLYPAWVSESEEKSSDPPVCNMKSAPTFRGIRLGMSVEDLLKLFPGSDADEGVKIAKAARLSPASYGIMSISFLATSYQLNPDARKMFLNVNSYDCTFADDHLVGYKVSFVRSGDFSFDSPTWKKKLIEELNFSEKWETFHSTLTCATFQIREESGTPGFEVGEKDFDKIYRQRRQQDEVRKRQDFKLNP